MPPEAACAPWPRPHPDLLPALRHPVHQKELSGHVWICEPNQAALSDEAQERYRTAYCGLCRRIDALHGLRGRFSLSYDLTFLNLLLCSLYEGETPAEAATTGAPSTPWAVWYGAAPTPPITVPT